MQPRTGICGLVSLAIAAVSCVWAATLIVVPSALAVDGWSAPTVINRHIGPLLDRNGSERGSLNTADRIQLFSLSCATASFCAAVGGEIESRGHGEVLREYERGYVVTYNGHSWSTPARIPRQLQLGSVSCSSRSFCIALGASFPALGKVVDYALTYNGHSWSSPVHIDTNGELGSVSCTSPSFCVAGGDTSTLTYSGGSWSTPTSIGGNRPLGSVSCASPSFCAGAGFVVANEGVIGEGLTEAELEHIESYARTYNGSSWSAPQTVDLIQHRLASVSCPAVAFCVAIDEEGDALTYNGSAWSAATPIDSHSELHSLSCPSPSFCVAVGGQGEKRGETMTYNGSTWSGPDVIDARHGLQLVSCPSVSFCVALDEWGRALALSHGGRGAAGRVPHLRRSP